MPELERLMLHELAELDPVVRQAYADFDYKKIHAQLTAFMTSDLSAFYFDVRKDALYCEPISSAKRKAALTVIDRLFQALVTWLAPVLSFTAEEAWLARYGSGSVHLELFPTIPADWRDEALALKWEQIRRVRRVVTGALEIERANKRIGSSLEAAPVVFVAEEALRATIASVDFAEVCITSGLRLEGGDGPADAFRLAEVEGVAVVPAKAEGTKVRPLLAHHGGRRRRPGVSGPLLARRAGDARMAGGAGGVSRLREGEADGRRQRSRPRIHERAGSRAG